MRVRELARRLRRRARGNQQSRPFPEMTAALLDRPRVLRAPPFTPELVSAIQLISPHLPLVPDEHSRRAWEAAQNGSCWGELDALRPIFAALPRPGRVLEIGPGLGRSAVFFTKQLGWHDTAFDLLEANGDETHYTILGPRLEHSFCGSIQALERVLAFNGLTNCRVIDAARPGCRLGDLTGPYDLIYSFYAIGFHWGLEHFLDDILALMREGTLAIFTIAEGFSEFPELEPLRRHSVDFARAYPADTTGRMLLLRKGEGVLA
jgi:hypothetical protein